MFKFFFLSTFCLGFFLTPIFCMPSHLSFAQKQEGLKVKSHRIDVDGFSKASKPR